MKSNTSYYDCRGVSVIVILVKQCIMVTCRTGPRSEIVVWWPYNLAQLILGKAMKNIMSFNNLLCSLYKVWIFVKIELIWKFEHVLLLHILRFILFHIFFTIIFIFMTYHLSHLCIIMYWWLTFYSGLGHTLVPG